MHGTPIVGTPCPLGDCSEQAELTVVGQLN